MQSEPASDLRDHRDWLASLVPIPVSGVWADIGCGHGHDLLLAASKETSPELRLVGIDSNEKAIEAAKNRSAMDDPRIEFSVRKLGGELPFDSDSLDVVFTNNLLECLQDRAAFVSEVARVLRPGGSVVAAHWDWDTQVFDSTDKDLVRRLVAAFSDWTQPWMEHSDGWMGRRLWGAFESSGRFDGAVRARVMTNTVFSEPWYGHARARNFESLVRRGLVSRGDFDTFLHEQNELSAQEKYFYSITSYAYVGRRAA